MNVSSLSTRSTRAQRHPDFAEVAEDFIEDDFNLTGLNALVPFYKEALDMVLDVEPEEESLKIPDVSIVESSAELLYGLIHQRYIITRQGLQQMVSSSLSGQFQSSKSRKVNKYEQSHFGVCPRFYCTTTRVLPCGRSDLPGVDTVKLFCPSCQDTYMPPSSRFSTVDGSFFGTTFPHLLFQSFKELQPTHNASKQQTAQRAAADLPDPEAYMDQFNATELVDHPLKGHTNPTNSALRVYVPKIYGFKVSERARSGPRMQWLRLKPKDDRELERVDYHGKWKVFDSGEEDTTEEEDEVQVAASSSTRKPVPPKKVALKPRGAEESADSFMDD
jgi:casein kinase II subunit beta